MSPDLPVSTPSAEGVDPAGLLGLVDALDRLPGCDPHGMMVLRHGKVIAQGWWSPYTATRPTLMYSLSKSFTASALGLAVGEELLDLDRPVADYLPELADVDLAPRMRRATLRQLVSMRSGHRFDNWGPAFAIDDDPVRGMFRLQPEDEPGTRFCYNQPPIMTVSAAVQHASGESLSQFLRPRLFDPLGITTAAWQTYPAGRDLGFTGLFTTVDAIARLGELYRCDGVWQGRRILPAGWSALASTAHADTTDQEPPDWRYGYGFGFWIGSRGFRGDGAWGQYCVVLPEQETVVAITSATGWMQDVLDAVWQHLLPAIDRAGQDADEHALANRLGSLRLPPAAGTSWTPELSDVTHTFTPATGVCAAQRSLESIEVAEGRVTLVESGRRTEVVLDDTAADDDAVVVAAAGRSEGLVLLDLHFVQTPHRMWVSADTRTGTFLAQWRTPPLHAAHLGELAAPRPGDPPLVRP